MNRKERRAAGTKGKTATYNYTAEQLESMKQQIKAEAVDEAMQILLAVPVLVLSDKYGFDQFKLDEFLRYVHTWMKAINQDTNTLKEVLEAAQNEAGYTLEMGNSNGKKRK